MMIYLKQYFNFTVLLIIRFEKLLSNSSGSFTFSGLVCFVKLNAYNDADFNYNLSETLGI